MRYLAPGALAVILVAVLIVLTSSSGGGGTNSPDRARGTTTQQRVSVRRTYVVRLGDTLDSIAQRFGVTPSQIIGLNPSVDAQALQPGTRLKLRP